MQLSSKVILHTIFTVILEISLTIEKALTKIKFRNYYTVFSKLQLHEFRQCQYGRNCQWISINVMSIPMCKNQDKTFSTIVKMICQCVTVLRQNVSLRQRHSSNRYLKLENAYPCVIRFWMWHDKQLNMQKGKITPSKTLIGSYVSKNDDIVLLWNTTVINETKIRKWVQDNLSFNKRRCYCIYHKDC